MTMAHLRVFAEYLRRVFPCGSDISEAMMSAVQARHGRTLGLRYVVASVPRSRRLWGSQRHLQCPPRRQRCRMAEICRIHDGCGWSGEPAGLSIVLAHMPIRRECLAISAMQICGRLFDLYKRRNSRQVFLLHDYGSYEFTIIVRKET